ncbi:hypothetical protein MNEG_13793, partial [Monoraphidium neglectum]
LSNPAMLESCPLPFDEGRLWKGETGEKLKGQLQVGVVGGQAGEGARARTCEGPGGAPRSRTRRQKRRGVALRPLSRR